MKFTVSAFGDRAVLVNVVGLEPTSLIGSLKVLFPEAQIRPGLASLLITFDVIGDYTELVDSKIQNVQVKTSATNVKEIVIPIVYNGEDLESVAKALQISVTDVIQLHQNTLWRVALIGFAPGFPYLVPVTPVAEIDSLGRLDSPRPKVPAGSVGLAAGMSCIYPSAMPGGWHLIGQTDPVLFDVNNQASPALLNAGDLVRFSPK